MSEIQSLECKHCNHIPFANSKNLKLHLRNSKKCAEKELNRPKPPARKHDLDDPECYGSDNDEPAGASGDADDMPMLLSPILNEIFTAYSAAVETLPDNGAPTIVSNTSPPPTSTPASTSAQAEKPFVKDFPRPTCQTYGKGKTRFDEIDKSESSKDWDKYGPFASKSEWELAKWLFRNVGKTKTDEFLKLDTVRWT